MELKEDIGMKGTLKMVFRSNETGEVLDVFEDNNVVLNQGKGEILRAFNTLNNNDHKIKSIYIGNDFGSGTLLAPQEPTNLFTEANQTVVYEVPSNEFFIDYPTSTSVRYLATINGANVMAQYPTQPNVVYTSATLRTQANKAIAYRRFGARTISSLISVDVIWTLTIL